MQEVLDILHSLTTRDLMIISGLFLLSLTTIAFIVLAGYSLYKKLDKNKKYFFGWDNAKYLIKELIKMYSNKPSFFSYKRFQTGTAFLTYQIGSRYALYHFVHSMADFAIWAAIELTICGYTLNQIQKEKKDDVPILQSSNSDPA